MVFLIKTYNPPFIYHFKRSLHIYPTLLLNCVGHCNFISQLAFLIPDWRATLQNRQRQLFHQQPLQGHMIDLWPRLVDRMMVPAMLPRWDNRPWPAQETVRPPQVSLWLPLLIHGAETARVMPTLWEGAERVGVRRITITTTLEIHSPTLKMS